MKNVLLIVDPQNDFITGSLAVEGAKEKMMKLADYIENEGHKYDYICITMDTHPENHMSFKENGGIWPKHCVASTNGWSLPEYINNDTYELHLYFKGTESDQEEYSIFDNAEDGHILAEQIIELFKQDNLYIDVCGIAGDYCVLETLKGLRRIVGDMCIQVLTDYTASIDGGEKLMNYLKENNINYK
jgi:nicotinamidase/pyrazinamidase